MALTGRPPCAALAPFVRWLWIAEDYVPGPHTTERILPSAETSLIVDLRMPDRVGLSGPRTVGFELTTAAQFAVAGIQFSPGGAYPFLDVPLTELRNQHVPLSALCGSLGRELQEALVQHGRPAEMRLKEAESVILRRLRSRQRPLHPAVEWSLGALSDGSGPVSAVLEHIGISHRRFSDLFRTQVGLTPKRFARVERFQRTLRRIREGRHANWTELAMELDYHDQPHFIHDFRAFSGMTPSEYERLTPDHYNHVPL